MPNENLTYLYVLTDRSGSMSSIRKDVIGGFNTLLRDQQKEDGQCLVTYAQFDHEYEEVFADEPIANVKPLTGETFVPRGQTALLDAWGRSMIALKSRIEALPENERPGQVIFVVITDGQENHSREFRRDKINEMVTKSKEAGWAFTFLAANQDAVAVGGRYGIDANSSLQFSASAGGVEATYGAVSRGISNVRGRRAKSVSYSRMDRLSAMDRTPDEDDSGS